MLEIIEYLKSIALEKAIVQKVESKEKVGSTYIFSGVSKYLFEELKIFDGMVEKEMHNRPGQIYPKKYITVHDTANYNKTAGAVAHTNYIKKGGNSTSWHYTVGNDGIYHHIPDNENAWHAGDGGREYLEIDTEIKADFSNPNPKVTISKDGYYEIASLRTKIVAPNSRPRKCPNANCGRITKDGEIKCPECGQEYDVVICTNEMINKFGIKTGILPNGNYYIGNTYFNTTYKYISNTGGNNNAIGIEMCVNDESDIFYTWQKNAKLVAKLILDNNLTTNDVKPHHYFSGKYCPAEMLKANKWEMFLEMVEAEYKMLKEFSNYKITFISHDIEYLNNKGKVIKQDDFSRLVNYTIMVEKGDFSKSINLNVIIPGKLDSSR